MSNGIVWEDGGGGGDDGDDDGDGGVGRVNWEEINCCLAAPASKAPLAI